MNILDKLTISKENFNTNNSWGFGGGIGIIYNLKDGYYVKIGKLYYRHLPPVNFYSLTRPDGTKIEFKNKNYLMQYLKDNFNNNK